MEAAADILDAAQGRGVHRATASRGAIQPEAEPQHTTQQGYDTQQLCEVVVGGRAQASARATAQKSTPPVGRERWAETVVERLQRLSRSIVVTALRNNEAFDARSPRL